MHTRYSVSVKSRENIEKITNAAVHHSEGEVERYRKMLDKPLGGVHCIHEQNHKRIYHRRITYNDCCHRGSSLSRGAYDTAANNIYLIVENTGDRYSIGLRSKSGRGFIGTHEQVYEDVTLVTGNQTAIRIGITWEPPHHRHQCYTVTAVPSWFAGCKWTN